MLQNSKILVILLLAAFSCFGAIGSNAQSKEIGEQLVRNFSCSLIGSGIQLGVADEQGKQVVPPRYECVVPLYLNPRAGQKEFVWVGFQRASVFTQFRNDRSVHYLLAVDSSTLMDFYTPTGRLIADSVTEFSIDYPISDLADSTPYPSYENTLVRHFHRFFHPDSLLGIGDESWKGFWWLKRNDGSVFLLDFFPEPDVSGPIHDWVSGLCETDLVQSDTFWGAYQKGSGFIVFPTYDDLQMYCSDNGEEEHLYKGKIMGKWGLISSKGKTMAPYAFDDLVWTQGSRFITVNGKGWEKKENLMEVTYFDSFTLQQRTEVVHQKDSFLISPKMGLIDKKGKKILSSKEGIILPLGEFLLRIEGDKRMTTDQVSEWLSVWQGRMKVVESGNDYFYHFMLVPDAYSLFTEKGKGIRCKPDSLFTIPFVGGLFFGNELPSDPDHILGFYQKGKKGVVRSDGKVILKPRYDEIYFAAMPGDSVSSMVLVTRENENWNIHREDGRLVLNEVYSSLRASPVYSNKVYQSFVFIGTKGGTLRTVTYDQNDLYGQVSTVTSTVVEGASYFLIDPFTGKRINRRMYDTLIAVPESSWFITRSLGKYGVMDAKGAVIFSEQFEAITCLGKEILVPEKNGKSALYYRDEQLLSFDFDGFEWMSEELIKVRSGDDFGVYSLRENRMLLPLEYDFIYTTGGDYIIIGKAMKAGLCAPDGRILLQPEYDEIDLYPPGFSEGIVLLIDNGKAGFYDTRTEKIKIPPGIDFSMNAYSSHPFIRVNTGGEPELNEKEEVVSIKGGKWGVLNRDADVLIPVEYDAISYPSLKQGLFHCRKNGKEVYFNLDGSSAVDGEKRWKNSALAQLYRPVQDLQYRFVSFNGPVGADATAFAVDAKGNYWLGTGSSGGVFVSSDKGKTWEARNEGLGPVHVVHLQVIGDTIQVYYATSGDFERSDFYHSVLHIRQLYPGEKIWRVLTEDEEERWAMDPAVSYHRMLEVQKNIQSGPVAVETTSYFDDQSPQHAQRITGIRWQDQMLPKAGFPKDVFKMDGGNLFVSGKDTLLLAVTGVYRLHSDHWEPLSETGLVASDITQIVVMRDGSVLLKEGQHDFWRWKNNAFEKVFDQYQWERTHPGATSWHCTPLTIDKNDHAWFGIGMEIYQIRPEAKAERITDLTLNSILSGEIGEEFWKHFAIDHLSPMENGALRVVCRLMKASPENYHEQCIFFFDPVQKEVDTSLSNTRMYTEERTYVVESGKYQYALAMNDSLKIGVADQAISISQDEEYPLHVSEKTRSVIGPNGLHLLWTEDGTLLLRKTEDVQWEKIPFFALHIAAMGFDHLGNLYVSTAQRYEMYCDGTADETSVPGLFRVDAVNGQFVFTRIPNPVNEKVLSITTWPGKGLLLGTSGSGLVGVEISK